MLTGILAVAVLGRVTPAPATQAGFDQVKAAPKDGDEVAVITTGQGRIVLMFFPEKAPKHVENFKGLAKEGFFDGTRFHRCIPGFMIQGGDPNSKDLDKTDSWGMGGKMNADGTERNVNAEFNDVKHLRGVLSMARASDPNSASSQFFIVQQDAFSLDTHYTAFGKVVEGMDVVDKIVKTGDRRPNGLVEPLKAIILTSVKVATWPLPNIQSPTKHHV